MHNLGGPIALGGFQRRIRTRKVSLLGGFSQNTVMVTSQIKGYRFWGGPIAFGAFWAIPTSHGILSLLTIAHIGIYSTPK